ncbi:MAG: DUF4124 domain-containing protein [Candidatus Competibacteraceae bacterium]|jgi:hypothetical protein|nr:DUF4124 domain-containing protein [Candidatus Competibacteraceae bacterium]
MKVLFLLILFSTAMPAVAQDDGVYRWQDEQGQVHYGDEPPAATEVSPVTLNAKPVAVKPVEQVYTWEDEQGQIHYGDQAPEDQAAEAVDMDSKSMSTIRETEFRAGERELLRQLEERSP